MGLMMHDEVAIRWLIRKRLGKELCLNWVVSKKSSIRLKISKGSQQKAKLKQTTLSS